MRTAVNSELLRWTLCRYRAVVRSRRSPCVCPVINRFTPGRRRLLERATLALGRLNSITLLLPEPEIFLYSYGRREAVLSSQTVLDAVDTARRLVALMQQDE